MTRRVAVLPVRSSAWFVAALAGTLLFAADLGGVETHATASQDRSLDLSLHHTFGPASYRLFELITTLGSGIVRIPLIALIVLGLVVTRHWWSAALTVVATGGAAILFEVIRLLVRRPRPHLFPPAIHGDGFSFPSGHATDTCAFALIAVYLLCHLSGRSALSLLGGTVLLLYVLLVGLSRLVLGVHYPTDVIGGYFLGAAWVALTITFAPALDDGRTRALLRRIGVVE